MIKRHSPLVTIYCERDTDPKLLVQNYQKFLELQNCIIFMALRQELREGRFVVNEKCNEFSQGECDWAVHSQVIGTNNSTF